MGSAPFAARDSDLAISEKAGKKKVSCIRRIGTVLILPAILLFAQEAALSQINVVERTQLDNGVTVLTKVNPSSEIVALRVYLPVGPRYEQPEQSGLSNLMLRLLQLGTESRDALRIALDVDSIGADFSTDVNKDYGSLVLKTTRATFEQGLDVFFDCLLHPTFPEDRLVNERETILKEIRQEKDSLLTETFRLFQKEIYQDHPYGIPAIGVEETVSTFEREDVRRFYESRLDPGRMVFVAVGNFDPEALRARLKAELGDFPIRREARPPALDGRLLPLPTEDRAILFERDCETEWLVLGYLSPSIKSADYAATKVLDSVMGGSMNSRLFTELRDKQGLAYQVGSTYPTRLGPSIYAIYIGAAPENHDAVIAGIAEQVAKICTEAISEEELERAKTYIKGTFIMGQETNMGQSGLYGLFETLGMGYKYVEEYPRQIDAVTAERLQEVAREYLTLYTLTAIRPAATEEKAATP